MATSGGSSTNHRITVDTFSSQPNRHGALSQRGESNVAVGARRAAIRDTQVVGDYAADFTVTVTY